MTETGRIRPTVVGTVVDEMGIEIGVYGDWRLKAEFTPVLADAGNRLRAVAVQGSVRPFVHGRNVDSRIFRRAVPSCDRPTIMAITAVLALRNLFHTGAAGLKVLLHVDPGTVLTRGKARAAARALLAEIRRNGFSPTDVLVDLTDIAGAGQPVLAAAAAALRSYGIGTAFRETGGGVAALGTHDKRLPDLVIIDGGWFGAVARQASTVQLFGALVRGYRMQGAAVWVEGIASAEQLRIAMAAGVEWLSGPLLSPAALAGAVFPEEALPVDTLLAGNRVVPLFG